MIIVIDIGHGGYDNGAVNNSIKEKDLNLIYGQLIAAILGDYAEVKLTRDSDIYFGLNSRGAWINAQNPDLIISCHFNACDTKAHGTEIIHSIHADQSILRLCDKIAKGITDIGFDLRRVFSRSSNIMPSKDYYAIIRNTKAPCIIIEPCFMDNDHDKVIMSGVGFMGQLALNISNAIIDHYKLQKVNQLNITDAAALLQRHKIINSPDYWAKGLVYNPDYVRQLIVNMAEYLKDKEV